MNPMNLVLQVTGYFDNAWEGWRVLWRHVTNLAQVYRTFTWLAIIWLDENAGKSFSTKHEAISLYTGHNG